MRKLPIHLPSDPSFKHYRDKCICCEESGKLMNKEHIFPLWLLERTNNCDILLNSPYGKIPGSKYTIPLCKECNSELGKKLESNVSRVFDDLETGKGATDHEVELLIRWLWKMQGMFYWAICNSHWKYGVVKLKERVLTPISGTRSRISIGIALIEDPYEGSNYTPVGLDTFPFWSTVLAAGVFSRMAVVVLYTHLVKHLNQDIWSIYTLSDNPLLINPSKRFFPRTTIETSSKAILLTKFMLVKTVYFMKSRKTLRLICDLHL